MVTLEPLASTFAFNYGPALRVLAAAGSPDTLAFIIRSTDGKQYYRLRSRVRRSTISEGAVLHVHFAADALSATDIDPEFLSLMYKGIVIRERTGISMLRGVLLQPALDFTITVE